MKKYLLLLVGVAAILTSCTTQRQIDKICSQGLCDIETIHDTTYIETIEYKSGQLDSLMWVSTFDFSQFKDTTTLYDTIVKYKDNTWNMDVIQHRNKLMVLIRHQSDSIRELSKEKTITEIKVREVVKEIENPIRTTWYWFLFCWWIGTIAVVVCWIWWQIRSQLILCNKLTST